MDVGASVGRLFAASHQLMNTCYESVNIGALIIRRGFWWYMIL